MNLRHLASIFLVACSGGLADPPRESPQDPPASPGASSGSPSLAPSPTTSPPSAGPAVSPGIVGVFHHGKLPATNLALRADGTFTWTREGCDGDVGGQCGTWKASTNGGVDLSRLGAPLRWIETGEPMQRVSVHETREGVEVTGTTLDGVTLHESWDVGRMCPVCRGGPGPATQAACETPLPDVCGR